MLDKHLIAQTNPAALPENIILLDDLRITVLTECLFRIEQNAGRCFCDQATQAVWYRNLPPVAFQAEQLGQELKIQTRKATLVWKGTMDRSFVLLKGSQEKLPLNNDCNLHGTYRTLDCCDGDFWVSPNPKTEKSHPIVLENGVLSSNGVAVFDDSSALILKEDGTLAIREYPELDAYVFAYGKDYRGAVKALYQICGNTPLIPRFALGNWWSRYHAYSEKEYLHLMDYFLERNIPLTVATVDMDWHWSKTLDQVKGISRQGKNDEFHGGSSGWTGYSWNTDLFPDYRRFLSRLHAYGLHITLNLHPADGVRYFEDCYPEMAEAMGIDPATEERIPFDPADPAFLNAYFRVIHKPYEHDGVNFWWIDWQQGQASSLEGLDPLWALNHYHFLDNALEHPPLILSRYSGIGSHRYPLGFSGDTYVTWKTLSYLPYFTATASNSGYAWWSHDIGGHMGGYKDDELYVRFLQFGVFSPINRLHSTNSSIFTKEPWAYMNGAGLIAEEFLRLRHRMIPFLYSAAYENTEQGLALIEPMYYAYPECPEAYRFPNQYLFGRQLLIAPITEKSEADGMARVSVWLPEGRWTDFFTGEEYQGGREVTMVRWLDSLPVLLKEGAFFVLDSRKGGNDIKNPDSLQVVVSNGNGEYTLYEDQEGKRTDTVFQSESADSNEPGVKIQRIRFTWHNSCENITKRTYRFEFCNIPNGVVTARADGENHPAFTDDNGRLSVILALVVPGVQYEVEVRFQEQEEEKKQEAIRKTLTRLPMEIWEKDKWYQQLEHAEAKEYLQLVGSMEIPEIMKLRLLEAAGLSSSKRIEKK